MDKVSNNFGESGFRVTDNPPPRQCPFSCRVKNDGDVNTCGEMDKCKCMI